MTYLTFLLVFVAGPILGLGLVHARAGAPPHTDRLAIALMMLCAAAYTPAWDHWLIHQHIWTYGPDRVWATLGAVPVEEYLFFVLQPLLTGLWWSYGRRRVAGPVQNGPRRDRAVSRAQRVAWAAPALGLLAGGLALLQFPRGQYLGLIALWVAPILALQWGYDAPLLWARRREVAVALAVPTLYLWLADRLALGLRIWTITPATSLPVRPLGLPVEEAVFFLLTNLMVVQGCVLASHVFRPAPLPTDG